MNTPSPLPDPRPRNPFAFDRRLFFSSPLWIHELGGLGRLIGILLAVATLIMAFYVEEKGRGALALRHKLQQLESQGISLDLNQLNLPKVPAEKNLAQTELLKPIYDFASGQTNANTNAYAIREKQWNSLAAEAEKRGYRQAPAVSIYWRKAEWPDPNQMLGEAKKPSSDQAPPASLPPDQAAQLVLDLFNQSTGPLLDTLHKESKERPYLRFDIPYDVENPFNLLLPHLAKLKYLEQQSAARSMAELYLKKTDPAFQDAMFGLFLSDGLKDEPFLISVLVRIAMREIVINPIWYGLATHQWNASQLLQLQKQFESVDMIAEMRRSMKGEMMFGNRTIETFRHNFPHKMNFQSFGDFSPQNGQDHLFTEWESVLNFLYPKGWLFLEQVNYLDLYKKYILDPAMTNQFGGKTEASGLEREIAGNQVNRLFKHTILAGMLIPALEKAMNKAAMSQTSHNLAATACALERYKLDKGQYPESLADLVPQYKAQAPQDIFNGKPLVYQRNADGTFILYSIGQNGVDDGGAIVVGKGGHVRQEEGDWVWKYPAPR